MKKMSMAQGPVEGAPLPVQQVMASIRSRLFTRIAAIVELVVYILLLAYASSAFHALSKEGADFFRNLELNLTSSEDSMNTSEIADFNRKAKEILADWLLTLSKAVMILCFLQIPFSISLIITTSATSVSLVKKVILVLSFKCVHLKLCSLSYMFQLFFVEAHHQIQSDLG